MCVRGGHGIDPRVSKVKIMAPTPQEGGPQDTQVVLYPTVIAEVKSCLPLPEEPWLQTIPFGTFR
jgi:hypothetical protein